MWTVRTVTCGAICQATGPIPRLFPRPAASRGADARAAGPAARQPWRIQLSGGSDPEGTDSAGGWCWQSHHVPPGQSS
jgi:hypothetical protein